MPKNNLQSIIKFFQTDIWRINQGDVSPVKFLLLEIAKKLLLAIRFFTTKGVLQKASALTYSTLLAIVPITAVVFAIARGFGYSKYIEVWFRDAFESQPQVAEVIIGFVNSYLVHTKSGVFLGIGLIFMLYTVLMLVSNVEDAFNEIWQVKKPRSIFRTFTDYLAMFFLFPIIIVLTSGISIFMATIANSMPDFLLLGPTLRFLIDLIPYVLMSGMFMALYIFMPNTHVKPINALFPGILAGFAMQGLQIFYIHSQIFLSSYNAIYGSFAALPLFMLWMQISWYICLFCAELSYMNQNTEYYAFLIHPTDISHDQRMEMSAALLAIIAQRFADGRRPLTALELKNRTHIPIRIATDLLERLCEVNLLISNHDSSDDSEPTFQPAQDLRNITVGRMVELLDSHPRRRNRYLSFHAKDVIDEEKLGMIEDRRNAYIEQMKQIPVTELARKKNI